MKKEDLTVPAIFAEAIGMILGIVYIGLQIYYGIVYKVAPYKFICNIAGVVLIYVGLSLVSCQPEKINRLPKEVCVGKVRKYSIRMIRLVKLVFIIGLMVPCLVLALICLMLCMELLISPSTSFTIFCVSAMLSLWLVIICCILCILSTAREESLISVDAICSIS